MRTSLTVSMKFAPPPLPTYPRLLFQSRTSSITTDAIRPPLRVSDGVEVVLPSFSRLSPSGVRHSHGNCLWCITCLKVWFHESHGALTKDVPLSNVPLSLFNQPTILSLKHQFPISRNIRLLLCEVDIALVNAHIFTFF